MRTPQSVAAANDATTALVDYLDGLIAERKRAPRDDMLSALIAAEDSGESLRHAELVSTILLLLIAGHETTVHLIASGALELLRHPAQMDRLRRDPELRYRTPAEITAATHPPFPPPARWRRSE